MDFHALEIYLPDTILPHLYQCVASCLPGLHEHQTLVPWVWQVLIQKDVSHTKATFIFDKIVGRGARKIVYDAVRCSFASDFRLLKITRAVFAKTLDDSPNAAYLASRAYEVHAYLYTLMPRTLAQVPFWVDPKSSEALFQYTQIAYPGTLGNYANAPFKTRCHLLALAAAALSDFHEKGLVIHGDVTIHNFFVTENLERKPRFSVRLHDFDLIESRQFPSDLLPEEFMDLHPQWQQANDFLVKTPVIDLIGFSIVAHVMFFPPPHHYHNFYAHALMCDAQTTSMVYPPRQERTLYRVLSGRLEKSDEELRHLLIQHRVCLIWEAIFSGLHALQGDDKTAELALRPVLEDGRSSEELKEIAEHVEQYLPSMKEIAQTFAHLATAKTLAFRRGELFEHLKMDGTL